MTTVLAVYEGGLLRPIEPLTLPEGQTVRLTFDSHSPFSLPRPSTPEEVDYARRLQLAPTLEEMFAVMAAAPATDEDDDDLIGRINESRRLTGFRMPDSDPAAEALP